MDDLTLRLSIAALEEIFIFVLFAALAHQKKRIGETAFYMSFCAVLFFGCVAAAAHLKLPWPGGYEVDFRQIVIQIPLMGIFLMVYITYVIFWVFPFTYINVKYKVTWAI